MGKQYLGLSEGNETNVGLNGYKHIGLGKSTSSNDEMAIGENLKFGESMNEIVNEDTESVNDGGLNKMFPNLVSASPVCKIDFQNVQTLGFTGYRQSSESHGLYFLPSAFC